MSVRIRITGLSPQDAETLFWAINSGELESLGVDAEASYIEPEERMAKKIVPLRDQVLVRPSEKEKQSRGGILLPDTAQKAPKRGEVLAVGPGWYENGQLMPMAVRPGDVVLYGQFRGHDIKGEDEEDLILMREGDILAKEETV